MILGVKKHSEGQLKQVEDSITLILFEKCIYPNNPTVRRLGKIVRFATIDTVKARWILKSKGRRSVTGGSAN